jgi:hypothetical protein
MNIYVKLPLFAQIWLKKASNPGQNLDIFLLICQFLLISHLTLLTIAHANFFWDVNAIGIAHQDRQRYLQLQQSF